MKKIIFLISLLLLSTAQAHTQLLTIITQDKNINFNISVAKDEQSKDRGLMFVHQLGNQQGMLFVYNQPAYLTFWMKNTLIPLDILFINSEKKIVDIQTMAPCEKEPCLIYTSSQPAQYALEINAGLSKEFDIKVNDGVIF